MADDADHASEYADRLNAEALDARPKPGGISAVECLDCGDPIPEERRRAANECNECGSPHTRWTVVLHNNGNAVDGRLSLSEIEPLLVLSCDECSATCRVVRSGYVDEAVRHLTASGPQQGHTGDALAALDRLCDAVIADCDLHEPSERKVNDDYETIRRHLTASGVPDEAREIIQQVVDYIDSKSPRQRSEVAIGWIKRRLQDALAVTPSDSGVPGELRRLPERWRSQAGEHDDVSGTVELIACATELEAALASAPAVPEELERPCWEKGVSEHAYVKGWNDCREAMIAAAPSDGGTP